MSEHADLIGDIVQADIIKQTTPDSGVTADAIFLALRLQPRGKTPRSARQSLCASPPEWFGQALQNLRGQRLSIRQFMLLSGRMNASMAEARDVGRWLRASGRSPYKCHGTLKFRI